MDLPLPTLQPRDVLVRVHASGINPVDAKKRSGVWMDECDEAHPVILGWDASGTVEDIGSGVTRFKKGDEVWLAGSIRRQGSYAQYVAVDERIVGKKPKSLTHEEAAAMPLVVLTAWEGMLEQMGIPRAAPGTGQGVMLVIGGAGGVGSVAVQIAKQVCGLKVVATASRPETEAFCRKLGADFIISHHGNMKEQLEKLGLNGADFILNTAPLDNNWDQITTLLKPFSRVCSILMAQKPIDTTPLFMLRASLSFELMFTRPTFDVAPELQGAILDKVADLVDQGILKTPLQRTFEFSEIQEAHVAIESGKTIGKLVIRVP
eukprot:TRINITY_DN4297_c1_g3_i1.p1 TRINITY_DN4297_c1_g3~~TRINITY_DN4297_c1_g3_i1.p1  ORF type:complete len:343 (+),score=87.41 TRINITY_DN4297_c1_g3_i1:73-1029(+)